MSGVIPMRLKYLDCFVMISMIAMPSYALAASAQENSPKIAPWYGGRTAAVSLRFDDNHESHLDKAIPILNRFDIKGTFMVSPGHSRFIKSQERWLKKVPAMGHELGNHTMHHRGADSLTEARYEISEAAKIIRAGAGKPDRLLVFASGGGKRWGGNRWSNADEAYLQIPGSQNMIDLYDGNHPYVNVTGNLTPDELIGYVDAAAKEGLYQAFTFHNIGAPTFRDIVRRVVRGTKLSYPEKNFHQFIKMLSDRSDSVWIGTLGDILKYQAQYRSARLVNLGYRDNSVQYQLSIDTDPSLYDHPLTLTLQRPDTENIRILQDGSPVKMQDGVDGMILVDLIPKNSLIQIDGFSGARLGLGD